VPDLPLFALLRAGPDLRDRPVVVTGGPGRASPVIACSAEALEQNVREGMTAAQAGAVCPELLIRPRAAELERQAQSTLADLAHAFSPRVESGSAGLCYLEATGLYPVFGTEARLGELILEAAAKLDLAGLCVGLAAGKGLARIAAHKGETTRGNVAIIPPGQERAFLAPLPLSRLLAASGLDPSEQDRLSRALAGWGLYTAGDLARLSAGAVGARLGQPGIRLHWLARGEEPEPFTPEARPLVFEERLEAEPGIQTLEPLLFGLRGLLDRLVNRLACRGLAARRMVLDLELETRRGDRRRLEVSTPTRDTAGLLALIRLELERDPPGATVQGAALTLESQAPRASQFDLFLPAGPAPLALAATLARLAALLGPERVGAPELLDSHAADAFRLAAFQPDPARPRDTRDGMAAHRLGFRAFRPPRPARVRLARGRPAQVRAKDLSGRVCRAAGPWRTRALWWEPWPVDREEWDVELQDGALLRLAWDGSGRRWVVEGEYD